MRGPLSRLCFGSARSTKGTARGAGPLPHEAPPSQPSRSLGSPLVCGRKQVMHCTPSSYRACCSFASVFVPGCRCASSHPRPYSKPRPYVTACPEQSLRSTCSRAAARACSGWRDGRKGVTPQTLASIPVGNVPLHHRAVPRTLSLMHVRWNSTRAKSVINIFGYALERRGVL